MIKIKLLSDEGKIPTKAHKSDAGWDLYASGLSRPVYPHPRRLLWLNLAKIWPIS